MKHRDNIGRVSRGRFLGERFKRADGGKNDGFANSGLQD
jgi:hypothetical protein